MTDVETGVTAMCGKHDTVAGMGTRLAGWLVTGPPGHLAAGLANWASLLCSSRLHRLRRP